MSEPIRIRIDGPPVEAFELLNRRWYEVEPGEYVAIPAHYWDRAILIPLCRWDYLRDVLRDAAAQLKAQCFSELAEECGRALQDITSAEPPRKEAQP